MVKTIGVVGTGSIAHEFLKMIDRTQYDVKAVFNPNPVSLSRFAEEYAIDKKFSRYNDFLLEDLDMIYIGSPNQTHYTYIKEALLANKHVLCEKVMVLQGSEARELFSLAKDRDLVLLEAMSLFYMPLYREVEKLIHSKKLGKMSGLNITFGSCKEYDPENRFFSLAKGGGALFDIGTYALSAAVFILGQQTELLATKVIMADTGVDEKSLTLLTNEEQVLASVSFSFRGRMPKQIILSGDEGYLTIEEFPRAEEGTVIYNTGEKEKLNVGSHRELFNYELERMNAYISGEIEGQDVRETTLKVIEIMDEMREQWGWNLE
ncbi:Gfo/Idh/MocA family protein [Vagococcus sp.]|uniref:Gfo/Idh/MocA family protein n=1 Tax=Vagococcus sp. TaxID=1933889 RepID=UPI003F98F19F